nr:chromatin remodeling protein shl [Quercus suber]
MPTKRKALASLKDHVKPSPARSTTQPPELSSTERSKITAYLDSTDKPFKVATLSATRKRKRESSAVQIQPSTFDDRLAVQYEVTPGTTWDSLRRYKKFTVVSESIAVGECVLVAHDAPDTQMINVLEQWKAQVLDVRALDPEHVYVRVAWLNRPEDLDAGRKSYHGKNELIPTNQIDIIDASSVNGRIQLVHWEENPEDQSRLEEDQFFWRQTFDYATTQTFSELKQICTDHAPENPDEMILQCSNPECRQWMHLKCVAEAAVLDASSAAGSADTRTTSKRASKTQSAASRRKSAAHAKTALLPDSHAQAVAQLDDVTAEVFIKGLSGPILDEEKGAIAEKTEIVVRNRAGTHTRELACLHCQHAIE